MMEVLDVWPRTMCRWTACAPIDCKTLARHSMTPCARWMQPLRKCGGNTIRWRRTFLSRAVFPKHVRHQEQEAASLVGAAQLAAGVRSWVSRRPQGVGAIARRAGYGAAISV